MGNKSGIKPVDLMLVYLRNSGRKKRVRINVGMRVAGGGAGDIHLLPNAPKQVLKLYKDRGVGNQYEPKLEAMLAAPPRLPAIKHRRSKFHQLAWPTAIAESRNGKFLGFTMPQIDFEDSVSLERMLQKRMRQISGLPEFYGFRVSCAYNLAVSISALHRRGHHIVDLKPANCRVYRKSMLLSLLDCDGFSILGGDGKRFVAGQYTPEYIAPESSKKDPGDLGEEQDRFALAVIIFKLLNNGLHPFQARLEKGLNGGTIQQMIEAGLYAYGLREARNCFPARQSVHHSFPDDLHRMFDQAFLGHNRPAAAKWRDMLSAYADPSSGKLMRCDQEPRLHAHFGSGCGWCDLQNGVTAPLPLHVLSGAKNKSNKTKVSTGKSLVKGGVKLASISNLRHPMALLLTIVSAAASMGIVLITGVHVNMISQHLTESSGIFSIDGEPQNNTDSEAKKTGSVLSNANCRSGPNTDFPTMTVLRKGIKVDVLGKIDGKKWYLVEIHRDWEGRSFKNPIKCAVFEKFLAITR